MAQAPALVGLWLDQPLAVGSCSHQGSLVYQVVLNRTTRTSQCTCSARTQPCVHAAALLIGWQQNQWEVVTSAPLAPWLPEQISPPKHSTPRPSGHHPQAGSHRPISRRWRRIPVAGQWIRNRTGWDGNISWPVTWQPWRISPPGWSTFDCPVRPAWFDNWPWALNRQSNSILASDPFQIDPGSTGICASGAPV